MKKNLLDNYLIGELYQVKNPKGYIVKQDLNYIGSFVFEGCKRKIATECENIGKVIVKKSDIFFKYKLREAITKVALDTLYARYNEKDNYIWLEGTKNVYHTFVVIPDDCNYNVQKKK